MSKIRAVVAAAGRGTRAGLPYPKTLFSIRGKSILVRITDVVSVYDEQPTIIVSPSGEEPIRQCLLENNIRAHLVLQQKPRGMGDAVLQFANSPAFSDAEHVLLIWGDIPFIQPNTVAIMVNEHIERNNDFTFVTCMVKSAYTLVLRDDLGKVIRVVETREQGFNDMKLGERDIGLFIFRKSLVLEALTQELPSKWGMTTGEHGFLYIIEHLVKRGLRLEGLMVATDLDQVSLNSIEDVDAYL
jgi:bifunctional UDP-N-acetylglucosamine pyrophosphorylase/glucosamine-1-phosphate N-acetyltransferase